MPKSATIRATVAQEDVLGLDVPVDDTLVVRVLQCVRDLGGNVHRLVDAELLLAIELLPERLPFHVRHDVVQESRTAASAAAVLPLSYNGRMCGCWSRAVVLISCRNRSAPITDPEFGPQHLQRHLAVVLQVLGEVDGGHAAFAKAALDAVTVDEGSGEAVGDVSHR